MVSPTIPLPGEVAVSTFRYSLASVPEALVSPRRSASFGSGRMAIRLPPAPTQSVNMETWASVSGMSPRMTVSYSSSVPALTEEMSVAVKALKPSLRRISA